jgi:putative heme-binding domain-containing protein
MLAIAADPASPSKDLALWWLLNRKGNDWSSFDLDRALKERGIYDPDKVQLTAIALPQPPANAPAFPPAAEVAALQGDPAKGSVSVALCYTCHHIGQAGVEFGPDLTAFGKQQTTATIVEAIVNPSASISHGYEGTEITTTDGLTITGMVLKHGDPLLLKCMGGTLQTIPKSRIASAKPLGRSLMYDPATLGLTPQTVADIVAYLKKP